jgi:hypothetical protein
MELQIGDRLVREFQDEFEALLRTLCTLETYGSIDCEPNMTRNQGQEADLLSRVSVWL